MAARRPPDRARHGIPMVHWLSFHLAYRCRHAGDCCTAGWPIPVEVETLNRARAALTSGGLAMRAGSRAKPFIFPTDAPSETPALLGTHHGACTFYEARTGGGCNIQRALGHAALPLACRQFPRVSVAAGGRVSVTLSHYCPTARAMLDLPGPASVVADPSGSRRDYVGLEASDLPPLLRPGLLMDWDAWWKWEALSVQWLSETPTDRALAGLQLITERVRPWVPGSDGLTETIRRAFAEGGLERLSEGCGRRQADFAAARPTRLRPEGARACGRRPDADHTLPKDARETGTDEIEQRVKEVLAAIPDDLRPERSTLAGATPSEIAHRRFLAAHAFANWTAYLGQGLRTWLRSIEAANALIRAGLGIREADLLLRHLADPDRLARTWSEAEGG